MPSFFWGKDTRRKRALHAGILKGVLAEACVRLPDSIQLVAECCQVDDFTFHCTFQCCAQAFKS